MPRVIITFHLCDAPGLGFFNMVSSSWDFATSILHGRAALVSGQRGADSRLALIREERTTRSGQVITYRRPGLLVNAR